MIVTVHTIMIKSGVGSVNKEINGAIIAALMAASEEIRNISAIRIQIMINNRPVSHDNPSITPSAVATPLPPLNEKKTG